MLSLLKKSMNLQFRSEPQSSDVERIREIVVSTGFFYEHEIEIAVELIEERLKEGEKSGYFFVFAETEGRTVAYSCFGPIPETRSAFDLYWIVTDFNYRGKGIGKKLLDETYSIIRRMGGTQVYAETSGRDHYIPTRHFYDSAGYKLESVFKDFYDRGDDKVVYVKWLV
jgi:ribosomal protein S18 acetylase RimI-like enzyme